MRETRSVRGIFLSAALPAVAVATAAVCAPSAACADGVPISVVTRGENRITMDGLLGDWRHFTDVVAVDEAAEVQSGADHWTGSDDASFGFAFARDEQVLYFAAEVRDDRVVRTRRHGPHEDALLISLAVPAGTDRFTAFDITVQPGDPGNFPGAVKLRGAPVRGAMVVEAPLRNGNGYSLEVTIPWSALPGVLAGAAQLRGRVAYQDADEPAHPAVDTVLASGPGDSRHPEDLPPAAGSTAGMSPNQLVAQFVAAQNLGGATPVLDRTLNVAGDAGLERVVVYPRFVVAAGSGIAGGTRYSYLEYPAQTAQDVLDASFHDVTGDGRQDLVLRFRQTEPDGLQREVLAVYGAPGTSDALSRIFAHDLVRAQGGNRLTNRATYEDDRGGIRVSYESVAGFTQQNYPAAAEQGVFPPLTPWGADRAVVYRWDNAGNAFRAAASDPNPNRANNAGASASPINTPPPANAQPAADVAGALRLFRSQHGLADNAQPTFSRSADVAGDNTPETVQIYGHYLVVVGSHYQGGRSYYFMELQNVTDDGVLGLELGDVTDDGRAEALVHVRRTVQATFGGQTADVQKEYLLVYSIDEAHRGRVFGAEIGRRLGNDGVENVVRSPGSGRHGELVIEPGHAIGNWGQQTYPFHDGVAQGIAPLLLPWQTNHPVTYRWNGTGLVAQ